MKLITKLFLVLSYILLFSIMIVDTYLTIKNWNVALSTPERLLLYWYPFLYLGLPTIIAFFITIYLDTKK